MKAQPSRPHGIDVEPGNEDGFFDDEESELPPGPRRPPSAG